MQSATPLAKSRSAGIDARIQDVHINLYIYICENMEARCATAARR
jgi:hypothetical protein